MKYVKIKDGRILDLEALKWPYICQVIDGKNYIDFNSRGFYEIVKQSDNIEKMFDVVVALKAKDDGKNDWGILSADDYRSGSKWEMDEYAADGYSIYGAAWSYGGLSFIAKRKDDGGWELL